MGIRQTDSDSLSEQLSALPGRKNTGRLRIYFGYAAGVGKTCAMLDDAHEAKKDGIDVVAGYIESHDRPAAAKPFFQNQYPGGIIRPWPRKPVGYPVGY